MDSPGPHGDPRALVVRWIQQIRRDMVSLLQVRPACMRYTSLKPHCVYMYHRLVALDGRA
jgi:hypothetical protein